MKKVNNDKGKNQYYMENVEIWKVASEKSFIDLRSGFSRAFFLCLSRGKKFSVLGEAEVEFSKWKELRWQKKNFCSCVLDIAQERYIITNTSISIDLVLGVSEENANL